MDLDARHEDTAHQPDDVSHGARGPKPPHRRPPILRADDEALDAASRLAADWRLGASERDRHRQLPWNEIEAYTLSGLGGITVPRAFGGGELSYLVLAKTFQILCEADPSVGQIPQSQFGVLELLKDLGTEDQKRWFFGEVLRGHRIGNAGPERSAKPIAAVTTRLERAAGGLRLTGRRFYSTGAMFAHWIPTRAIDEDGKAVQVWVPHGAAGVSVKDDWSSFGQRTTASGTVEFDNVAIAEGQVFPVWTLADRPGIWGPASQLIQAAIDAGIARAALNDALVFVREKARPWVDSGLQSATDDPTIIHEVGYLATQVEAAEALLHEAASTLDDVTRSPITAQSSAKASVAVAEAKILTTEAALETTEKLFDLAGSSSTRAMHNLDRHWRNARVHTLHDPVRWKYHLLGNYHLNGVFPPRHQWN